MSSPLPRRAAHARRRAAVSRITRRASATFAALLLGGAPARADTGEAPLAPLVVTATRNAQSRVTLPVAVDVVTAADLRQTPALTLDDALRSNSTAFSLFRRSGSLTAHPTAQGVSLRGIGPSGASRTLVLLDGVPLNDPFGGWVSWSQVPRLALDRVELVRGGGSAAWGNAALGGTVQVLSAPLDGTRGVQRELAVELGDFALRSGEFAVTAPADSAALRVGVSAFATDGTYALAPGQRGAVDRPLDSRHTLVHTSWAQPLNATTHATVQLRYFDEERGNGTPLQRNSSQATIASLRLDGAPSASHGWTALAYAQRQTFASGFSAVAAGRATETPANDQFDVPADAAGASFTTTLSHAPHTTTLGADVRWVEGETREDYLYQGDGYTRRRFAGGTQLVGGVFAGHQHILGHGLSGSLLARVDAWQQSDGHRREMVRAADTILRDDRYADRSGVAFTPSVGLAWQARHDLRLRAAAYRAFRLPTLNEYFRPFRIGNVTTEANPDLTEETLAGAELGGTWTRGPWSFTANGFQSDLRDAVSNITLAATPAGTTRQRQNLERVRVRGAEATLAWHASPAHTLALDYLLSDARVRRAMAQPALVGRRLAQVPRHTLALRTTSELPAQLRLSLAARWIADQFEDDENALTLAEAVTADVALSWAPRPGCELGLAVENLADTEVETARTAQGLTTISPGRWARATLRLAW